MAFVNRLPDPGFKINAQGLEDPIMGLPAPGFKGVNLTSIKDRELVKTRSKRAISVSTGSHEWQFSIQYNPMTEAQKRALEAFVYGHGIVENPFYVVLPNYSKPLGTFGTSGVDDYIAKTARTAGSTYIDMIRPASASITGKIPSAGDMFNINNSGDFLHQNTYKVGWVETPTAFNTSSPGANTVRIHIFPSLQRSIAINSNINFFNPKFRVISKSTEFSTSTDAFGRSILSLDVEEVLP